MTTQYIFQDADFGKIKDLSISGDTVKDFLENEVYTHPNWCVLLCNLSDIHVLVARNDTHLYLREGETSWKDIMSSEQYEQLEKNGQCIVGYMLVDEPKQISEFHYIELMDTMIRKHNLGYYMIERYENNHEQCIVLLPKEIIYSSVEYWAKIFKKYYDIESKNDLDNFIHEGKIRKEDLSWKHLYNFLNKNTFYD